MTDADALALMVALVDEELGHAKYELSWLLEVALLVFPEERLRSGAEFVSCSWSSEPARSVGRRRCEKPAGARGVVGVNKGVSEPGGSELSRTERSVARRPTGVDTPLRVDSDCADGACEEAALEGVLV